MMDPLAGMSNRHEGSGRRIVYCLDRLRRNQGATHQSGCSPFRALGLRVLTAPGMLPTMPTTTPASMSHQNHQDLAPITRAKQTAANQG